MFDHVLMKDTLLQNMILKIYSGWTVLRLLCSDVHVLSSVRRFVDLC